MKVIQWSDVTGSRKHILDNVALTIGVFDGVHLGHQKILWRIVHNGRHLLPVVITFAGNPAKILKAKEYHGDILTGAQKIAKLQALGVSTVVLIDFSYDFSRINAEDFFNTLTTAFTIKEMVVGYNFHFGHAKKADIKKLAQFAAGGGMSLKVIKPVTYKRQIISSTRIRKTIIEGKFAAVRAMLGDEYVIRLPEAGAGQAENGLLHIDKAAITQILPAKGRYLCGFYPKSTIRHGFVEIMDKELVFDAGDDKPVAGFYFIKSIADAGK